MSILVLDDKIKKKFVDFFCFAKKDNDNDITQTLKIISDIYKENKFVVIRNLFFKDFCDIFFLGFLKQIGEVFEDLSHQSSVIVDTSPKPKSKLTGDRSETIPMHTDFSMLINPPETTIIFCIKEDPLGPPYGQNGISLARDIFNFFHGSYEFDLLTSIKMPFAGKKQNASGENIIIESTVFHTETESESFGIRFHPSRIYHGFRLTKTKPSKEQSLVISSTLRMAKEVRIPVFLNSGDALIINNKEALHDRTMCSFSLNGNSISSRLVKVAFLNKFNIKNEQ